MTNFTKAFAILSAFAVLFLAGLFAVGFAYGADAVVISILIIFITSMVLTTIIILAFILEEHL